MRWNKLELNMTTLLGLCATLKFLDLPIGLGLGLGVGCTTPLAMGGTVAGTMLPTGGMAYRSLRPGLNRRNFDRHTLFGRHPIRVCFSKWSKKDGHVFLFWKSFGHEFSDDI